MRLTKAGETILTIVAGALLALSVIYIGQHLLPAFSGLLP